MSAVRPRAHGANALQSVWRLAQHALRSQERQAVSAGATADRLLTLADHEWMRQACQTGTEMVRAVQQTPLEARIFKPGVVDQMYQYAGFNFTYFFKGHNLQSNLLKHAIQGVLSEVPHLAGRGRVLGSGSRFIDSVIDCTNEGVEFATARAHNIRLEDVGPHTWSQLSNGTTLSNAPMAFYDQPLDPAAARRGDQAPVRIRLTNLADGQVLSTSCWHTIADAGRGIKLAARLSDHYRALATGQPVSGKPLRADSTLFHSPDHLKRALAEDVGQGWEPKPVSWEPNIHMTLKQRLSTPLQMHRSLTSRWDVHTLYLPQQVVARVKAATIAAGGGYQVSTADAVQAMLFTMMNDLRGRPLVPTKPQMFTVTADILHGLNLKDTNLASHFLGNAIEIVFLEGGTKGQDSVQYSTKEDMFMAALASNARLIHDGVAAYRADSRSALNSIAGFHNMVHMSKLKIAADYTMKAALQKCASSSYITKFPLQEVNFGTGGPYHVKTDILPWSDWWYCATAAAGVDDGKGIISRMVLEHGTAQQVKQHPLWRSLAAGAQLAMAGERTRPFGLPATAAPLT